MGETLESLEQKREQLYRQLTETGDFRRGTISVVYRKCGKRNCVCAGVSQVKDEKELTELKKKLQRRFMKKYRTRLPAS